MNDSATSQDRSVRRRSWPKRLLLAGSVIGLLCLVAYFVATSSGFLKSIVLPRVGRALGAELRAGNVSLSPWSELALRDLEVRAAGSEPLARAGEVRLRYRLTDLVRGKMTLNGIRLADATFTWVQNPDGTSNLDPLLQKLKPTIAAPPEPSRPSAPLQFDVHNIQLLRINLRLVQHQKDGARNTVALEGLDLNADQVGNGLPGKADLSASFLREVAPSPSATHRTTETTKANLAGSLSYELDTALRPRFSKGSIQAKVQQTPQSLASLVNLETDLDFDIVPAEIRQAALKLRKGALDLGQLRVTGPWNLETLEADLKAELSGINQQLFNLLGAGRGWDFGQATLGINSRIRVNHGASAVQTGGQVALEKFSVRQTNMVTPVLDLLGAYELELNLSNQVARVDRLELSARQNNIEFLQTRLDKPMALSWSSNVTAVPDSALRLTLTNLNLGDWRAFTGPLLNQGRADAALQLNSTRGGHQLDFEMSAALRDASLALGTNRFENGNAQFRAAGDCQDLRRVQLRSYRLQLADSNRDWISSQGSISCDLQDGNFQARTETTTLLSLMLQLYPMPELAVNRGTLRFNGAAGQKDGKLTASGALELRDLAGSFYTNFSFPNLPLDGDFELEKEKDVVRLLRALVTLGSNQAEARTQTPASDIVGLSGTYDLGRSEFQGTYRFTNLTQRFLEPWIGSAVKPFVVASANCSGEGTLFYGTNLEASIAMTATNLALRDVANATNPALDVRQFRIQGSWKNQNLELKECSLALAPTSRARNQVQLTAQLDLATTNAKPGFVSIRADSFDLTPLHRIWTNRATAKNAPVASVPGRPASKGEPAPISMPVQQANFDLQIGALFLEQMAVSNWTAQAKLLKGVIDLNPFQLTLNGSPMRASGTLNLGAPGYGYDIDFFTTNLLIDPLLSLAGGLPSQPKAALSASAQIKGQGTTGANLRQHLKGAFDLDLTNLNYSIVQAIKQKWPPERNPALSLLLLLANGSLQGLVSIPGLGEINRATNLHSQIHLRMGEGAVAIQSARVVSDAFVAQAQGRIPFADDLANSPLELPVDISLKRELVEKVKLLSSVVNVNADWAELPGLLTMQGTLGQYKTSYDLKRFSGGLIGNLLKSFSGGSASRKQSDKTETTAAQEEPATPANADAAQSPSPSPSTPGATRMPVVPRAIPATPALTNRPSVSVIKTNAPISTTGATRSTTTFGSTNRLPSQRLIPQSLAPAPSRNPAVATNPPATRVPKQTQKPVPK